jgi:hypothetical protein
MTTLTIPQSNYRNIHSIANQNMDRDIKFPKGAEYAVVAASYYGGKGYTTHRTENAAIRQAIKSDISSTIIDSDGDVYLDNGDQETLYFSHSIFDN